MLPSFFKLYSSLIEQTKTDNSNFEFKIIFRTFGVDHKMIYEEFLEYLRNEHPIFENKYPEVNPFTNEFENCGNFMRSKDDRLNIVLISGIYPNKELLENARDIIFNKDLTKQDIITALIDFFKQNNFEQYNKNILTIHQGLNEIHDYLLLNKDHFMIIQDDYETWHYRDEKNDFAKPLIIDLENTSNEIQLFFDDHCNPYDDWIVNVIDLGTGNTVPYEEHINKYSLKVSPFDAIQDQEYFINKVRELMILSSKL